MALSFMEGNEAVVHGAIAAGCNFFAGYPITPATTVFNNILKYLPSAGGICMQGEDEIASMGCCLGASMAGKKVMTATSGPGISLYSEQISFAIGSEIPIVIIDVQRLGPSTGSATRGADGDIQFMRWGNSGGLPVIVLAPIDAADCFVLTMHAFNLAETYRCPVFLASNKEIGMTKESVDIDALDIPKIVNRTMQPTDKHYLPFAVPEGSHTPYFLSIGAETPARQTSSTHGTNGYITTETAEIQQFQDRLRDKLDSAVDKFSFYEEYIEEQADTLVISYGMSARTARHVCREMKSEGKPVSLLILKTLWPVPENLIKQKSEKAKRVVLVEMNLGQYVREIQRILPQKEIIFSGKMNGALITPQEIRKAIEK